MSLIYWNIMINSFWNALYEEIKSINWFQNSLTSVYALLIILKISYTTSFYKLISLTKSFYNKLL